MKKDFSSLHEFDLYGILAIKLYNKAWSNLFLHNVLVIAHETVIVGALTSIPVQQFGITIFYNE